MNNSKHEFATRYARDFRLRPQGEEEPDSEFHVRVVRELREAGRTIEAHEVNVGRLYDQDGPGSPAMLGILGAVASEVSGRPMPKDGYQRVGDEFAAGTIVSGPPEPSLEEAMLSVLLFGGRR